jgi:hypothetical protein
VQAEVAPAFRATKDSLRYCLLSDLRFDQSRARVARPHAARFQRASLRKTHVQSVLARWCRQGTEMRIGM